MKKLLNKVKHMNNTQRTVLEACLVVTSFAVGGLVAIKCLEGGDR